jgi:hypothetical protein
MSIDGRMAEAITEAYWIRHRAELVEWLKIIKGFTHLAAHRAANAYIDTVCFVARETGTVLEGK